MPQIPEIPHLLLPLLSSPSHPRSLSLKILTIHFSNHHPAFRCYFRVGFLQQPSGWFSRGNTEILRFVCTRFIRELLRSCLSNSHVRKRGKQDLGQEKVELCAFVTVTAINSTGSSGIGMCL